MLGSSVRLYIPFISERIGYDCRACGARCCGAGHLRMTARERRAVLSAQPRLALMVVDHDAGNDSATYAKLGPRCWFSSTDGRCELERTMGRGAKPHTCRSHPVYFHSYGNAMETVGVAFLMPGCRWVRSKPAELGAMLEGSEITASHAEAVELCEPRRVPRPWYQRALRPYLEVEEAIRDASSRFDDVVAYLAWQLALSAHFVETRRIPTVVPEERLSAARRYLQAQASAITGLLGTTTDAPARVAVLDRVFLDFGSLLRLSLLGLTPEVGPAAPRVRTLRQLYMSATPMLAALHVYATSSIEEGRASSEVSYDWVHRLLVAFRKRLFACTQLVHPVGRRIGGGAIRGEPMDLESFERMIAGAPHRRLLEHLEHPEHHDHHGASTSVEARITLLELAGAALEHREPTFFAG